MPLHDFEHMCSSSGGQNCITQPSGINHTETSEWSKIAKIQFYKYEQMYFSDFRPLTCFSVMIPEVV